MKNKRHIGRIVSWKTEQGYGFIHPLKGADADLFLHINDVQDKIEPKVGDVYVFSVEKDKKGNPIAAFAHPHKPHFWKTLSMIGLSLAVLAPFVLSVCVYSRRAFPFFFYLGMSVIAFLMHREDKRRAEKQLWRIPDDSIHLVELLGGWPGTLIGQRRYQLKARKKSYQGALRFIIFLHLIGWVDYLLLQNLILWFIIEGLIKIAEN